MKNRCLLVIYSVLAINFLFIGTVLLICNIFIVSAIVCFILALMLLTELVTSLTLKKDILNISNLLEVEEIEIL